MIPEGFRKPFPFPASFCFSDYDGSQPGLWIALSVIFRTFRSPLLLRESGPGPQQTPSANTRNGEFDNVTLFLMHFLVRYTLSLLFPSLQWVFCFCFKNIAMGALQWSPPPNSRMLSSPQTESPHHQQPFPLRLPWSLATTNLYSPSIDWLILDISYKSNCVISGLWYLASLFSHNIAKVHPCCSMH